MSVKEQIIEYLITTYKPEAIIIYGSYADGTANANSDFDALIVANSSHVHDEAVVIGVTLDVFIYPPEIDIENIDMDEFIQIHDGKIELDKNGIASRLKERVLRYIENIPFKTDEEIHQEIEWCKKSAVNSKEIRQLLTSFEMEDDSVDYEEARLNFVINEEVQQFGRFEMLETSFFAV